MLPIFNKYLFSILLFVAPLCVAGQSADQYFHNGARMYIGGKDQLAKNIVNEGLTKFPGDPKLGALKEKLNKEKDKKDQEQNQQNKDQQDKKDQQKQDQQQKDQEQKQKEQQQKDQEKKDGQKDEEKEQKPEQKDEQQKDGEKSEQEKKEKPTPSPSDKLKEMNISEEKAKMILEAMKNNEIQYIQQNKRKATKRKNSGKPDW